VNEHNLTRYSWERAVISERGPASGTTRHVLLTLATHVDRELVAFPSVETLTDESGLSNRTVRTHLAIAERDGWINRSARREGGKAWANYVYKLTLPPAGAAADAGAMDEGAATDAAAPPPQGAASLSEGAATVAEGAATDSTLVRQEVPTNKAMNTPRTLKSNTLAADQVSELAGTARGQLAALLRQKGVQITPGNPLLVEWQAAGLTEAEALEAVARVRLKKPEHEPIPPNYLFYKVQEVLQERGNPRQPIMQNGVRVGTGAPKSQTTLAIEVLQAMKSQLRGGSDTSFENTFGGSRAEHFNIIEHEPGARID